MHAPPPPTHLGLVVALGGALGLLEEALALHERVVELRVGVADLPLGHEQLKAAARGGNGFQDQLASGGHTFSFLPPMRDGAVDVPLGEAGLGAVGLGERGHDLRVLRDEGRRDDVLLYGSMHKNAAWMDGWMDGCMHQ